MTGSITQRESASVDVRPVRSQVFLVAVTVVAGISVFVVRFSLRLVTLVDGVFFSLPSY